MEKRLNKIRLTESSGLNLNSCLLSSFPPFILCVIKIVAGIIIRVCGSRVVAVAFPIN